MDLGARRIGIAVSDDAGAVALPRPYIERGSTRDQDHDAIARVVEEVGARVVVVGLPRSLDGRLGAAARAAQDEVQALARRLEGVHVETHDERFTTVLAHAALADAGRSARDRRKRVDSAAAAVLLQSWLDSR